MSEELPPLTENRAATVDDESTEPQGAPAGGANLLPLEPEVRKSVRVLVVEDERTLLDSLLNVLRHEGYTISVSNRGDEALDLLRRQAFDIVLLDLYMSQVQGMDLLAAALAKNADTIAIVMTGNPTIASSLEALRAGAWDYLPKPFSASHLQILMGRAAHAVVVARESRQLRSDLNAKHGHSTKVNLLGSSTAFRAVMELARKVAATDASVFITGESGTGKELIAQFIHHHSRRSSRALLPVNCAALPEQLLESEMFGHVKGAFTGAVRDKPGLLEAANGGTIFMDELTEMSTAVQAKLLRVIQDGVLRRVGSNSTDAVVTVRFIAATNRDPQEAVEEGVLRRDLYYRLRVVPIHMPALRERPDDIPVLASYFLDHYWKRHRGAKEKLPTLSPAALRALQDRHWSGNVRELQNVIEHAVVLLDPGATVAPGDLPDLDGAMPQQAARYAFSGIDEDETYHAARERVLGEFEREYLRRLVDNAHGNMSKAAKMAGVDRTTLYRLMDKHGLQRDTILTTRSA